jgi:NADPH:quinone reductase
MELPMPTPRPKDIVVRNKSAGVNVVDVMVRNGKMKAPVGPNSPIVVGWDGAGVVSEVGSEAAGFSVGDEVFYTGDLTRNGSYAEYTAVDFRVVAPKPKTLSFERSAGIPLAAATAWESIVETFDGKEGQSLLIYNGAGGVGSFAIQLAKVLRLRVLATAGRPESISWCKMLGADHVLNHRCEITLRDQLTRLGFEGVDFILHLHDSGNLPELIKLMNPLGAISLANDVTAATLGQLDVWEVFSKRISICNTFMFSRLMYDVKPEVQGELLAKVAKLIDAGHIRDIVTHQFPWKDAAEAQCLQEKGGTCGKTVLTID